MRGVAVFASLSLFALACGSRTSDPSFKERRGPTAVQLGRIIDDNPIPAENQRPGNPEWRDGWRSYSRELELYLSTDSQVQGGFVSVKVSSDISSTVTAEVYRLGYYGGAGARRVWSGGPFNVSTQGGCPVDPTTGRVECDWNETFYFQTGTDWVSGIYLVKVQRPDPLPYKRFAPFVVRDGRAAEILFTAAFNTYQAYNNWGGESLYQDDSGLHSGNAFEVSYNRPYVEGEGAGQALVWEQPTLFILEKSGYDVTYATDVDYLRRSNLVDGIGAVLIAGHSEYWSVEERGQVDAALNSGQTSVVHLSANSSYWRVRFRDDWRGNGLRTIVGYKGQWWLDPIPGSTLRFRDEPNANPETLLFGVGYDGWQYLGFPLVVRNSNHWLFQGTGITDGELIPELVGTEFDRLWPDLSTPPDVNLIADSALVNADGFTNRSHMVERTLPAGNTVFSAGAISWASGLNLNWRGGGDERVVRMFLNAIERALTHRRAPVEPPAPGPIRPDPPVIQGEWAFSVEPFAGVAGASGWSDGSGDSALFSRPSGLASMQSGQIVVSDAANHVIRLVDTDPARTVRTIAGTGSIGTTDGVPGAQAKFAKPNGVAIGADGAIYVVDTENQVIRRIENNPPTYFVSRYAGRMQQAGFVDSPDPLQARFNWPVGLASDSQGNLFVAEIRGNRIRMIRAGSGEVTTYAGNGGFGSFDAPIGTNASFSAPTALAVGPTGDIYVMEAYSQYIRRISPADGHRVDTIAGQFWAGVGQIDGAGSVARFRAVLGMAVTAAGEILLADTANYRIRKIVPGDSADSTRVSTIAGSGRAGTQLGSGDVSDIGAPTGLTIAPDQSLIVSDSYNHVLRKITLGATGANGGGGN